MVLYDKEGNEALVDKSQVELMIESGWMKEKPELKVKAVAKEKEVEETVDDVPEETENVSDDTDETETSDAATTTKPKTIRKLGKK